MANPDVPKLHEDLYAEIVDGAGQTGTFVIETEEENPDIRLECEAAGKPTRNKLQRHMPDGLLDGIDLPDNVEDAEDLSVDDIDLSDLSVQDMTFGEEATEIWLDVVADEYDHVPEQEDYVYSETELRNIFANLGDEYFISAGTYLIELGEASGPVTGFRRED
jgi:hypothetical protein